MRQQRRSLTTIYTCKWKDVFGREREGEVLGSTYLAYSVRRSLSECTLSPGASGVVAQALLYAHCGGKISDTVVAVAEDLTVTSVSRYVADGFDVQNPLVGLKIAALGSSVDRMPQPGPMSTETTSDDQLRRILSFLDPRAK